MSASPITALLARRRVPLGFAAGAAVLWLAAPTGRSLAVGGGVALLGEALRIWAAGHLYKAREVTSSGPYRYLGHPLYAGSSIMGLGLGLASNSVIVAMVIALYLALTISAAVRSEEATLARMFGDDYRNYRARRAATPAPGPARRFSLGQAIANHEHRTVAGLAAAGLLLVLKATYNGLFWGAAAGR